MQPPPSDHDWLELAARLSLRGRPLSRPNPSVGAVLVRDGAVVGRGWTRQGGRPHAEAMALAQAGEKARGATAYVTLEPCAHVSDRGPACADGLIAAGVSRVVAGVRDPDPRTAGKGLASMRAAGIEVVCADHPACLRSLAGYLTRISRDRPHVTLKLALSLDGCLATAAGASRWITGDEARAHVHSRRALADAILVGGGTWRVDAPRLDVRLPGLADRSPGIVVLTSGQATGAATLARPQDIGDLAGAQYLYVEGGAKTAAAFLASDLVDRLEIYHAPIVIGGGQPGVADLGLTDLAAAHGRWRLVETRQLGSDRFTAYERSPCSPA